ncbi:hypothetical protein EUX98_g1896 [Antrodiella citrinella]|uniref:G-protein coupled receptors family 1 profile domain-containing protein n=1 Tax=Antrodiella citrinella TaxID=2447956 RepID=A0A4S4N0B8_9APHY|nr:hypothetical protein EUX98_g1896 [Antrodiella citrinella]
MSNPTAVFEHAFYIGSYLSGILYGFELIVYFSTIRRLYKRAVNGHTWGFFFVYSTVLFILVTIDMSTNAVWGEIMWIDKRDNPGVSTFIVENLSVWYQIMGSTTVVAMVLMGDALLLHRLYLIWGSNIWVVVLPGLVYCGTLTLGILELVSSFKPGGFFLSGKAENFGTPYYSITICMNILLTILICARLYYLSKQAKKMIGFHAAERYTSLAAIMIESAVPYTVMGIILLPFYARGNDIAIALGQVWSKLTCLAPQMIVLRIVSGRAWDRQIVAQIHSGQWSTDQETVSQRTGDGYGKDLEKSEEVYGGEAAVSTLKSASPAR